MQFLDRLKTAYNDFVAEDHSIDAWQEIRPELVAVVNRGVSLLPEDADHFREIWAVSERFQRVCDVVRSPDGLVAQYFVDSERLVDLNETFSY